MLTVVTTRQPGLGNFLTRLLSAKPLARLADLSYDVYLIHSFVRLPYPCPLSSCTASNVQNFNFAVMGSNLLPLSVRQRPGMHM